MHQTRDTFCYLTRCFGPKEECLQIDCFLFIKFLHCLDPPTYDVFGWSRTGGARNLRKLPTRIVSAFTYLNRQAHVQACILLALSRCYVAEANCEVWSKCRWCLVFFGLMSMHIFFIGVNNNICLLCYGFRRMGVCLIRWLSQTVKLSNQGLQLLNISRRLVTVCCIDYSSVLSKAEMHEFLQRVFQHLFDLWCCFFPILTYSET